MLAPVHVHSELVRAKLAMKRSMDRVEVLAGELDPQSRRFIVAVVAMRQAGDQFDVLQARDLRWYEALRHARLEQPRGVLLEFEAFDA